MKKGIFNGIFVLACIHGGGTKLSSGSGKEHVGVVMGRKRRLSTDKTYLAVCQFAYQVDRVLYSGTFLN